MSDRRMLNHVLIPVAEVSSVGEARRAGHRAAQAAGLNATDAGRLAIIVTELATNLARHALPAGRAILIAADTSADGAVEITSIDTGPGMGDVARCFEDGFSTAGTPGNGLGAVRRQSDDLDYFTGASGTVLWARVMAGGGARTGRQPAGQHRSGGLSIPAPGETECGDGWRIHHDGNGRIAIVVADGLGHGPLAAEASQGACQIFDANPFTEPDAIIHAMHAAVGGTRGAAVAVARIDSVAGKLTYAGVGNISGTLLAPDGTTRGLFSHNGIVGHQLRKVQSFEYPWTPASVLVLHSDGLQSRWALDKYPGLIRRHPAVLAGLLYRDFRRGRDDASVVVTGPPKFAS